MAPLSVQERRSYSGVCPSLPTGLCSPSLLPPGASFPGLGVCRGSPLRLCFLQPPSLCKEEPPGAASSPLGPMSRHGLLCPFTRGCRGSTAFKCLGTVASVRVQAGPAHGHTSELRQKDKQNVGRKPCRK